MQARAVAAQSFSATVQPQQTSQIQIPAPTPQQPQEPQEQSQQQPPPPVTPAPAGKVSFYQFTITNFFKWQIHIFNMRIQIVLKARMGKVNYELSAQQYQLFRSLYKFHS